MPFKLYCDSKVTVFIGICCVQGGVYGVQHMAEWLSWGFPLSERSLLPAADCPPASNRHLRGGNQRQTAEDRWGAEWENTAVWLTLRSGCLSLWQRQSFSFFFFVRLWQTVQVIVWLEASQACQSLCKTTWCYLSQEHLCLIFLFWWQECITTWRSGVLKWGRKIQNFKVTAVSWRQHWAFS